jgi:hypothetical protein
LGDSQGAHSEELSLQHQCGGEVHAECRQSRLWRLHKRIFETSLLRSLDSAGLDDQNAKKVSDAISDARQTLKKVHCFIWSLCKC